MPNHVYNAVTIRSKNENDLIKLRIILSRQQPVELYSESTFKSHVFNFLSIIAPEEEIWDEYTGKEIKPKPTEMSEIILHRGDDWYNWNIRNWGTKWNAYDVDIYEKNNDKDELIELRYTFSTAWSQPTGIISGLVDLINELKLDVTFDWTYEEETGWGGSVYFDGKDVDYEEYDEPSSHADYVNRDREDSCVCSWGDDEEYWFSDCPKVEIMESKVVIK
jgi:hypothetical protein